MEWQGSNNGPSWQDVCDMLTALDSLHGCETFVALRREGEEGVSKLSVTIHSLRFTPTAELEQLECTNTKTYPCNGHKTLAGLIFGMLHTQDQRINKAWYRQSELPT